MRKVLPWVILGFSSLYLLINLQYNVDEIRAIQTVQMMGYEEIVVIDKVSVGAWWRRDCSFPKTFYLQANAVWEIPTNSRTDTISMCLNELTGDISISVKRGEPKH